MGFSKDTQWVYVETMEELTLPRFTVTRSPACYIIVTVSSTCCPPPLYCCLIMKFEVAFASDGLRIMAGVGSFITQWKCVSHRAVTPCFRKPADVCGLISMVFDCFALLCFLRSYLRWNEYQFGSESAITKCHLLLVLFSLISRWGSLSGCVTVFLGYGCQFQILTAEEVGLCAEPAEY